MPCPRWPGHPTSARRYVEESLSILLRLPDSRCDMPLRLLRLLKFFVEYYAADVLCGRGNSVSTKKSARLMPFLRPVGCADKRSTSGISRRDFSGWGDQPAVEN